MNSPAHRYFPDPVVILGNGEFPRHPLPLEILKSAKTLICTDGSTDKALKAGLSPTLTIGDLDSITTQSENISGEIVHIPDQNRTDLEKALEWCLENGIQKVTLIGISNQREDHTLANFFVIQRYAALLDITVVTNHFTVVYVDSHRQFTVQRGQKVSLVPIVRTENVTTDGLKFALDSEPLELGARGISNEAVGNSFSVTVDKGGIFVFVAHQI